MTRNPIPPEARDLLLTLGPTLRRELAVLDARPAAFVVVSRERATTDDIVRVVGALRVHATGDHYLAAPLGRVRALAGQLAPEMAPRLDEPLPVNETWCLIFGPNGTGVAPILWPNAPRVLDATRRDAPSSRPSETNTAAFLRRWPATAHLADRLTAKPNARGAASFRLRDVVDVFEEFLAIVDATDIAPADMRNAAENIRAELPALRAQLDASVN